ncbi:phosphotransferase [Thalassotalea sp. G2M2-11]|uniref:phosphotransferase n=1 Tax=Thalassotalea sp. G2M2-11 TaxID=2787627 RepID=UPI0019D25AE8|nr:phosphotransferase [Thalassotalea sp. G2M2-11]
MAELESVIAEVKQLPCFVGRQCHVTAIEQGLSHACFKVEQLNSTGENIASYFVKYLSPIEQCLSNERQAMQLAFEVTLSPHIVYSNTTWLVTAFIDGELLAQTSITEQAKIDIAVKLLNRCHQIPLNGEISSLTVDEIIERQLVEAPLQAKQRAVLNTISQQITQFQEQGEQVLCHGDMNFSNIIIDHQQTPWLIDFECAFLGFREFDLAMLIAINQLPVEIMAVSKSYQSISGKPINEKLVNHYLPCCYFINGLWFYQRGQQSNSSFYLQLAKQQFQLFDQLKRVPNSLTKLMLA